MSEKTENRNMLETCSSFLTSNYLRLGVDFFCHRLSFPDGEESGQFPPNILPASD